MSEETGVPSNESASGVPEGGAVPPAPDAQPAPEPTDWDKRIQEWGGEQAIQDALQIAKALQNPDGVAAMFVEAGRALGVPFERLNSLFEDTEAKQEAALVPDPDAPVTAAQLQEAIQELRKGVEQQTVASRAAAARVVIDAEVQRLGLDPDEVPDVLEYGSRHLADGDFDPDHIRAAIAKGYAEWQAKVQKVAEKYVKSKQQQRDASPNPLTGGGTPSGSEEPTEPKNLEEAKARVRAQLARAGVLA